MASMGTYSMGNTFSTNFSNFSSFNDQKSFESMKKEYACDALTRLEVDLLTSSSSGRRELHPYVRPGICTIILSISILIFACVIYRMHMNYNTVDCSLVVQSYETCQFF